MLFSHLEKPLSAVTMIPLIILAKVIIWSSY